MFMLASKELREFCLFVDSLGVRDTGLTMVYLPSGERPSPTDPLDATVTIRLHDTNYHFIAERSLDPIAAGTHMARFVHEMCDDPAVKTQAQEMEGILVVESDQPLVAVTVRQNDDPGKKFPNDVPILTAFPVITGAPHD